MPAAAPAPDSTDAAATAARPAPSRPVAGLPAGPPDRRALWLALGLALPVFAWLVWRFDFVCDDAYISFRYARNWAEGHGPRYNLGPERPVEGYSNFLWVAWAALCERVGLAPAVWARVTSVACGVALLVWTTVFAQGWYGLSRAGTVATALVLATLPPLVVWSTGGLATVPATLAIFGAFALLPGRRERPRGVAAGLCGLTASLLRADGAAWVLLVLLLGLGAARARRDRSLLRATLVAAVIVVGGTAAHVVWRHGYYGDWLPNTARIKAGFSTLRLERGFDYLVSLVLTIPSLLVATGLGIAAVARRREAAGLGALAVIAATTGYAVYVGGDFMAMGRFVTPMMPFVALAFAAGWRALVARDATADAASGGPAAPRPDRLALGGLLAAAVVALSLLPCFDRYLVPRSVRARFHFRLSNPEYWTELRMWDQMKRNAVQWAKQGRLLAAVTEPGESIVLGPIGAIGYYSRLYVYDTYGLTSRAVALEDRPPKLSSPGHDQEVPVSFFFRFEPDYLSFALAEKGTPRDPRFLGRWSEHAKLLRIEAHPIPPGLGFDPEKELWLLRLVFSPR